MSDTTKEALDILSLDDGIRLWASSVKRLLETLLDDLNKERQANDEKDKTIAELKQELDGMYDLFREERSGLYRKLALSNKDLEELKADKLALFDALQAERIEREAAQRTIDRLGGAYDDEDDGLISCDDKGEN